MSYININKIILALLAAFSALLSVILFVWTRGESNLFSDSLGEIFGGLCFSSSGRSFRGSPQVESQRPEEGPVAPVCKWGNHQSGRVAQVFVPVGKLTGQGRDDRMFI